MRNPLTAILGWAVLLKKGETSDRTSHAIEVIERNARVEAQLVDSLLDLSRIAAGKLELDTERVDLSSVIHTVVDSVRPMAEAAGITLDVVLSSPLIVIGDSGRLQQVFSNLLANAVKFTPREGHVQVHAARIGFQARIQVADDGDGIDPDFLPHVFDRFRQAETARKRPYGGLGLGLAIVRELVHAHSGTVAADSAGRGHGTTFTVTLPIAAVIPAHVEAAGVQSRPAEEPSIAGLRILVVDHDSDARELVTLTLKTRGAVTRSVSSAAEAIDCVVQEKPDVMIADIGLPDEDGYMLIRRLRQLERATPHNGLTAIALTAYASAADRDQALAAGYDLHLTKRPGELIRTVARFRKSRGA